MVRVFYTQKTEQLIKKLELTNWRKLILEEIDHKHQDLSDDWGHCAIGERIMLEGKTLESIQDLSPEAIKLGYDFSVAIQERDVDKAIEIITMIEKLPSIWRDE